MANLGKGKIPQVFNEDMCGLCQTSQNFVGNMTMSLLLVNSLTQCGHKFCSTCIERAFAAKRQFSCPICGTIVKKNTLTEKSLDELEVQKDYRIRKRITEIFNKSREDFSNLKEYCDYQEMVEDYVYNLLNGIDLEATETQIDLYQTENMQSIRERQSHIAEEERRIEMLIKHEQQAAILLAQEIQEKDFLEKQKGQLLKKQTIEVMMGERDTISSDLITNQETNKPPMSQFSRLMASAATGLDPINANDLELQIAPTLLDLHRMQRLPPKIIVKQEKGASQPSHDPHNQRSDETNSPVTTTATATANNNTSTTIQRHIAGGYSLEIFFKKNWNETMSELKHSIKSQKSESLSYECSLWLHEWNECK